MPAGLVEATCLKLEAPRQFAGYRCIQRKAGLASADPGLSIQLARSTSISAQSGPLGIHELQLVAEILGAECGPPSHQLAFPLEAA